MDSNDLPIILATTSFLFSLIFTTSCIPFVNKLGLKYKIIDEPDIRKKHRGPIVRLGGLGIFIGLIIGMLLTFILFNILDPRILEPSFIALVLSGSLSFFLIGLCDDIFRLTPFIRLVFQVIITCFIYANGIRFNAIDLSWASFSEPLSIPIYLSFIISIIWIVGITIAINWIDGLDGLAAGVTVIISIGLILIFISLGKWDVLILCSSLCGASIGFLRYNFYPAKILMGDGGSYLLGSTLGIISLYGLSYNSNVDQSSISNLTIFPIHLAILLFFIPGVDMAYVIFSRIAEGFSPFYPDRRHLHHRILRKGMHHRSTVIVYYAISLILVTLAVCSFNIDYKIILICISSIILGLFILYCLHMGKQLNSNYRKDI